MLVLEELSARLELLAEHLHDRALGRGSRRPIDEADVGRLFLALHGANSQALGIQQTATDTLDSLREALEASKYAQLGPRGRARSHGATRPREESAPRSRDRSD